MLARDRLDAAGDRSGRAAAPADQFLAKLILAPCEAGARGPRSATNVRIERSRLLRTAGLIDMADAELRFGARNDGQPALLAWKWRAPPTPRTRDCT